MDNINQWRFKLALVAEAMDYFRIVPRLIIIGYSILLYDVVIWFMNIPSPTMEQSTLVSVVVTIAGVVIGLYTKSGHSWDRPVIVWTKEPTKYIEPKVNIIQERYVPTNGSSASFGASTKFTPSPFVDFPDID